MQNSRVRKLGIELFFYLIYSIWKLKLLKIVCHFVKICLEVIFLTSFYKINFANLQSIVNKKKNLKDYVEILKCIKQYLENIHLKR